MSMLVSKYDCFLYYTKTMTIIFFLVTNVILIFWMNVGCGIIT